MPTLAPDDWPSSQVRRVVNELLELGAIGVCGLGAHNNHILFDFSGGSAGRGLDRAPSPDSLFLIGSQTKSFTAAAVLLLESAGILSLDDRIGRFLRDDQFSSLPREITIVDLLNHRSGIGDYTDYFLGSAPPNYLAWPLPKCTDSELIKLGEWRGQQFSPGARWRYNNTAYVLLGAIVAGLTGTDVTDFIKAQVLTPRGLSDTYFGRAGSWPRDRCIRGYFKPYSPLEIESVDVAMQASDLSIASSAGDMISNLHDMVRWMASLVSSPPPTALGLNAFLRHQVRTRVDASGWLTAPIYALGMESLSLAGRSFWGHNGATLGYRSGSFVDPSTGVIVALVITFEYRGDDQLAAAMQAKREQLLCATATEALALLPRDHDDRQR